MFRHAFLLGAALSLPAMVITAGITLAQQDKAGPPIALSPDASRAARGDDKTITVFDPQTNKEFLRMQGHTDKVTSLVFTPDGKVLASGGLDKSVCLWDVTTGRQIQNWKVPGAISGIAISGDGRRVIVRDGEQTTREYELSNGKLVRETKDQKK